MNALEQEKLNETKQLISIITNKAAVPLYLLFWVLDLIYVPHYKWEFLAIRCLILPAALLINWCLKRIRSFRQAEWLGLLLIFVSASILNSMIYTVGQGALYSIPLHLVAIGGLAFIPWSKTFFGLATTVIYGPYLASEARFIVGGDYSYFAVNSFFIGGMITITWVIKAFHEHMRAREIAIRQDLEQEINKRKQTEQDLIVARDQALEATRAKESFLANMSHEIRTPMTAIIGYADSSLDEGVSMGQRVEALDTIRRSGNHLLHIINDILDFSKIEAGELQVEKLPVNPLQQVAEVESLVLGMASAKGLDVGVDYAFPLPETIHSDPFRIKQILLNLCSNAIKFTEHGSIRIAVHYDKLSRILSFRIKDTGIGMTPEQLDVIFTPFKQADSSTARRFGGTGLGLSLSQNLAGLLGGKLSVQSEIDKGSIFEFSLQLDESSNEKLISHIDDVSIVEKCVENKLVYTPLVGQVLLVEDNKTNQQLIRLYLEKMGASVTCANNGEMAVGLALQHRYDLVYMDMQMPVMPGVDAVKQLRGKGYTVPIVMLTANATAEDRQQCLQAGANDFLTKPIVRQTLYETSARFLSRATHARPDKQPIYSTLLDEEPDLIAILRDYPIYLKRFQQQLAESYHSGDLARFNRFLHDLKGTAGSYGYPQLSQLAVQMETHIKQQEMSKISILIDDLNDMCTRIYQGLEPSMPDTKGAADI